MRIACKRLTTLTLAIICVSQPVNVFGLVVATIGFILHTHVMQRYKLPSTVKAVEGEAQDTVATKPEGRLVIAPTGGGTAAAAR